MLSPPMQDGVFCRQWNSALIVVQTVDYYFVTTRHEKPVETIVRANRMFYLYCRGQSYT